MTLVAQLDKTNSQGNASSSAEAQEQTKRQAQDLLEQLKVTNAESENLITKIHEAGLT